MLMQDTFDLVYRAEVAVDLGVPIVDQEFAIDAGELGAWGGDDAIAGLEERQPFAVANDRVEASLRAQRHAVDGS